MARDLRAYARQTNRRLILGGILLMIIVGDGLIYIIYGRNAALSGFFCLIAGLLPLLLIWLVLLAVGWLVGWLDQKGGEKKDHGEPTQID